MRAAAIWSLGYLHEGKPDTELVKALEARIKDVNGLPPESWVVCRMSAVTIGRMKAHEALPTLESFSEPQGIASELGYACAWAIEQITGRPFKKPEATTTFYTHFFLEPLVED